MIIHKSFLFAKIEMVMLISIIISVQNIIKNNR